jgi:hypothetical protein
LQKSPIISSEGRLPGRAGEKARNMLLLLEAMNKKAFQGRVSTAFLLLLVKKNDTGTTFTITDCTSLKKFIKH